MAVNESDEVLLLNSGFKIENRFIKPAELEICEIKSLCCVNECDVILGVESKDKVKPYMDLYHIDISSPEATWTQFFDPTRPRRKSPSTILTKKISDWDADLAELVFIGNVCSADIGTAGRLQNQDPISTFFLTTEEFLPQLPVSSKDSRSDQYPIGLALDFTNPELTPSGSDDAPPFPASPVLWIVTNEGFLCGYRVIKNNTRTQYREMNLNVSEFPNILKKRPAVRKPKPVLDSAEPKTEAETEQEPTATVDERPALLSNIDSGFVNHDYGKYTNALIEEFLKIQNLIENDLGQLGITIDQNHELLHSTYHQRNRSLRHLERDTLKAAQNCDNPAFLELFKMEKSIHELAHQIKSGQFHAESMKGYSEHLSSYSKNLQAHRQRFTSLLESYERKIAFLQVSTETPLTSASLDQVKGDLDELQQSMSLLRLCNTKGKVSSPATVKPNKTQLSAFAQRLAKRSPADCMNVYKPEVLPSIVSAPIIKSEAIDPRFYACIFPLYDEDDFASEEEPEDDGEWITDSDEVEGAEEFSELEYDVQESEPDAEAEVYHVSEAEHVVTESEVEAALPETVAKEYTETEFEVVPATSQENNAELESKDDISRVELKTTSDESPPIAPEEIKAEYIDIDTGESVWLTSKEASVPPPRVIWKPMSTKPASLETPAEDLPSVDHAAETVEASQATLQESSDVPEVLEPAQIEEAAVIETATVVEELDLPKETVTETVTTAGEELRPQDVPLVEAPEAFDNDMVLEAGVPEAVEGPTEDMDISGEPATEPAFALGSLSMLESTSTSNPPSAQTKNIFGVPVSTSTAPALDSSMQIKPPSLTAFARKPEDSIFSKPAPSAPAPSVFGSQQSGFGTFGGSASTLPSFGPSAFGTSSSSSFGSSAFGASATPSGAFGVASTSAPTFGSSTPSAFGSSTPSAFGSSTAAPSAFGSSTAAPTAFGSSTAVPSAFGSGAASFGSSIPAPAFGSTAFGSSTAAAPAFGASGFGNSSFGAQSTVPATPTQPAKVFGQGSTGFSGFSSLAQSTDQQQQQKKNLPSSFSQFRE